MILYPQTLYYSLLLQKKKKFCLPNLTAREYFSFSSTRLNLISFLLTFIPEQLLRRMIIRQKLCYLDTRSNSVLKMKIRGEVVSSQILGKKIFRVPPTGVEPMTFQKYRLERSNH